MTKNKDEFTIALKKTKKNKTSILPNITKNLKKLEKIRNSQINIMTKI